MILGDFLALSANGARVVAHVGEKNITQDYFLARISQLHAQLQKSSKEKWLLFSEDALAFSIALLALLCAGKKVIIAPNQQPGSLESLAPYYDAFFSGADFTDMQDKNILQASFELPSTAMISIVTSGSTGAMKLIDKPLPTFVAELNNLEKHWGRIVDDAVFFSTVSHQHIYGLLFRVLWPLSRGRVFMAQSHAYPEPLFDEMARCDIGGKNKAVLVSSPAHLTRIPEAIDGVAVAQKLTAVFSSGGPLPAQASAVFEARFGTCPIEIFGSTETGGIAWRQQSAKNTVDIAPAWHAFADVELKVDEESDCLAIRSPYAYQRDWFVMGDRVELLGRHRFLHRGRADRIVKLEEKRLSLTAMEQCLLHHPWVEDAKLVMLSSESRQMLGAVLVLNAEGAAQYVNGKRSLNENLKQHLLGYFERVLLPRKWRYVTVMPCNSQGKVVQQDLQDLFA